MKNHFSYVVCTAVTRPATLRRAAVPVTKGVNKIVAVFFFIMGLAQRKGGNFEHAGSRHPFSIERANRLLHHVQVSIALLFVRVAPHDGRRWREEPWTRQQLKLLMEPQLWLVQWPRAPSRPSSLSRRVACQISSSQSGRQLRLDFHQKDVQSPHLEKKSQRRHQHGRQYGQQWHQQRQPRLSPSQQVPRRPPQEDGCCAGDSFQVGGIGRSGEPEQAAGGTQERTAGGQRASVGKAFGFQCIVAHSEGSGDAP